MDIADKVEEMGEGEIKSHGRLTGEDYDYEVVFRYPISFDIQGEMIEEAEARLRDELAPDYDWRYWAGFDDGPQYFQVVAVYTGHITG